MACLSQLADRRPARTLSSLRLDKDYGDTHNAQYRQYDSAQARWMSPDPYDGSYDLTNPKSLNRYAYAFNMPLSGTDPSG